MNKYIVAYISLFENQLKQTLVEADTEVSAVYKYLAEKEDIIFEEDEQRTNLDQLIDDLFNMDSNLSVYKLD